MTLYEPDYFTITAVSLFALAVPVTIMWPKYARDKKRLAEALQWALEEISRLEEEGYCSS